MPQRPIQKTIKDMQGYLGEFATMAKPLSAKKTKQLNEILTSIMVLLVALRKTSRLGESDMGKPLNK